MAINGYRIRYEIGTAVPVFVVALSLGACLQVLRGEYRKFMPLIEEQLSCVGEDGPFLHSSGKDTHEQAT